MDIIIPKRIVPVHSFDLWGPIVDSGKLGKAKMDAYKTLASRLSVSEEEVSKVLNDYQGLIEGQPWATGERKSEIIDGLESPLKKAGIAIGYEQALQEDGVYVIGQILDAGEGVIVFTSKPAESLRDALPGDLGKRIGKIYADKKTDPEAFRRVFDSEQTQKRHVVSHTADEMPELEAAVKSELFTRERLVYINRNDSNSAEKVHAAGIGKYVNDLRNVNYLNMIE